MKINLKMCLLVVVGFLAAANVKCDVVDPSRCLMVDFGKYKLGLLHGQRVGPIVGGPWVQVGTNLSAQVVDVEDKGSGSRVLEITRTNSGGALVPLVNVLDLSQIAGFYLAFDVFREEGGSAIFTMLNGTSARAQGIGVYINAKGGVQVNAKQEGGVVSRVYASKNLLSAAVWYRVEVEGRQSAEPGLGELDVYLTSGSNVSRQLLVQGVPYDFDYGPYNNFLIGPQAGTLRVANIVISSIAR